MTWVALSSWPCWLSGRAPFLGHSKGLSLTPDIGRPGGSHPYSYGYAPPIAAIAKYHKPKTTQIYNLWVPEVRSLKWVPVSSKTQQLRVFVGSRGESAFPCLSAFRRLPVSLGASPPIFKACLMHHSCHCFSCLITFSVCPASIFHVQGPLWL